MTSPPGQGGAGRGKRSTLQDPRHPALICRERGWAAGTCLEGDEGRGPTVIEITAIGQERILARALTEGGRRATYRDEGLWNLSCRDWRPVPHPFATNQAAGVPGVEGSNG
ncbi:hypothetical protein [Roseomonas chloroacetimidivorans]|uniref:DUF7241 domain-containing protein n=1 Tax=Roseomonas chloroacetimidivorans TaxID=1766656 RepID=UPI003C7569BB